MSSARLRALALACAVAAAGGGYAAAVDARPGGGGSFSPGGGSRPSSPSSPGGGGPSSPGGGWHPPSSPGSPSHPGSSGSSGSSGGNAAGAVIVLVMLVIFGAAGVLPIVIVFAVIAQRKREEQGWTTTVPAPRPPTFRPEQLRAMLAGDPDFSQVLFEDFLYALFAEVHVARGAQTIGRLAPYVGESVRASLEREATGLVTVRDVVIGAMKFLTCTASVSAGRPMVSVQVEFEANFTEVRGDGREQSCYVSERWWVARSLSARSRPPEKVRIFACPNCGAPLDAIQGRSCSHCNRQVDTGDFDWIATEIEPIQKLERGPMLTGTTEETGTDLPTVVATETRVRLQALCAADPRFDWAAFCRRVTRIHEVFQVAWSDHKPLLVRPYMTDSLFQVQLYWIATYERQRLRNVTEKASVKTIELAKVVRDRYFDALTVRVWASSLDYTVDAAGAVVGGSRDRMRVYTEYWTLVRGTRCAGAARADAACPNCGAPLDVSMTGACTHCKAKLTMGEFDWVLSRIEQDEVYS